MTRTKRFAATAAALVMAVSMVTAASTMTAFAASASSTPSITIKSQSEDKFDVYQLLVGTIDGKEISSYSAGSSLTNEDKVADVITIVKDTTKSDAEKSTALEALIDKTKTVEGGANLVDGGSVGVGAGYYLVIEKGADSKTAILLKVVGDAVTVTPKLGVPTLEKKVGEEKATLDDKYGEKGDYKYNDVADHYIGEQVPFKLYGTLPANLSEFKDYMYKINDSFNKGITVDESSIVVKIDDTTVYTAATAATAAEHGLTVSFTQSTATADGSIVVNFVDILAYGVTSSSKVTVEYNGNLNSSAEVATSYQLNAANLIYSATPNDSNWESHGTKETSTPSNPGTPGKPNNPSADKPNGDEEKNNKGETPDDKVALYTYKLYITKTDGSAPISASDAEEARFTVKGPDGYIATDANNKVTSYNNTNAVELTLTGSELIVIGLDDGDYTITETKAPKGYKLPNNAPVSFKITIKGGIVTQQDWVNFDAVVESTYKVDTQTITVVDDDSSLVSNQNAETAGTYKADVKNSPKAALPETGGMGTKLFYAGGGALVLVSGVILVARKRAKSEQ